MRRCRARPLRWTRQIAGIRHYHSLTAPATKPVAATPQFCVRRHFCARNDHTRKKRVRAPAAQPLLKHERPWMNRPRERLRRICKRIEERHLCQKSIITVASHQTCGAMLSFGRRRLLKDGKKRCRKTALNRLFIAYLQHLDRPAGKNIVASAGAVFRQMGAILANMRRLTSETRSQYCETRNQH
jgi:hypothetical protein